MGDRYVAFIPVRAGSKSIPLKNVRVIAGKPLVQWTLEAAAACEAISRVVVSTDSPEIERAVLAINSPKVLVHHRSSENATDTASTESVMLEYAAQNDAFENMVLIQATSPLLRSDDLERGIELFEKTPFDSIVSVTRQKRFIWREANGVGEPVNYDPFARPRRQEFDGFLVENGAFYITSREALVSSSNRISGRVGCVEMDDETYYEIDEPSDWVVVEQLLERRRIPEALDLSRIRALFTDCDGVMTDGGMYYTETGDEGKKFQTRDGMGFALLRAHGIIGGIITSERVDLVERRARKLQLEELHMGVSDKLAVIHDLCEKHRLSLDEIAYIGDDVMDLPVIKAVGFGCSVADAMPAAQRAADYVTRARGGEGAVREVAELILADRGN